MPPARWACRLPAGHENLLVEVPGSSTLDEAGRTTLTRMLEDAGVEHTVIRDDAAGQFE